MDLLSQAVEDADQAREGPSSLPMPDSQDVFDDPDLSDAALSAGVEALLGGNAEDSGVAEDAPMNDEDAAKKTKVGRKKKSAKKASEMPPPKKRPKRAAAYKGLSAQAGTRKEKATAGFVTVPEAPVSVFREQPSHVRRAREAAGVSGWPQEDMDQPDEELLTQDEVD